MIGNDTSTVKSLELSMVLDNGFPLDIASQIYFVDENYEVLDSLSSDLIHVSPATVSGKDVVQSVVRITSYNVCYTKLLRRTSVRDFALTLDARCTLSEIWVGRRLVKPRLGLTRPRTDALEVRMPEANHLEGEVARLISYNFV